MACEDYINYPLALDSSPIELDIPEWGGVFRTKRLEQLADMLTSLAMPSLECSQNSLLSKREGSPFGEEESDEEDMSIGEFTDTILLIELAREPHGWCEFFFSFAFLDSRTVARRERFGVTGGPKSIIS